MEPRGVEVEGIVASRNKRPYVRLSLEGKSALLSVADARNIAIDILQLAARAEADAMILKFFDKQEYPEGAGVALMVKFRGFRAELDAEEVEKYKVDPDKGHVQ